MAALTILRKGQHGSLVKGLQSALKAKGYAVNTDGFFGPQTELAVVAFQRRSGLLPDGIAGPQTLQRLGLHTVQAAGAPQPNVAIRFSSHPGAAAVGAVSRAPPREPSKPPRAFSTSREGLRFLYVHEALRGVSNHLHWPGGGSGVTLGPGYDMGGRAANEITDDLTSVGVDAASAKVIGDGAAGLTGQKAKDYAQKNQKLVDLSGDQEMKLLRKAVPKYEQHVTDNVQVDLFQYQFDALVCFVYNCWGRRKVFRDINDGKVAAAMDEMRKVNTSGGKINKGLVNRREHEIALYLYGQYGKSV